MTPPDTPDLVERLRGLIERLREKRIRVHDLGGVGFEPDPDCIEAADAIDAAHKRIAELEAALEQCASARMPGAARAIAFNALRAPSGDAND